MTFFFFLFLEKQFSIILEAASGKPTLHCQQPAPDVSSSQGSTVSLLQFLFLKDLEDKTKEKQSPISEHPCCYLCNLMVDKLF